MLVCSRPHASDELIEYIDKLKPFTRNLEFISAGCSLKLYYVTEGKADEYPRLGPAIEWDTATGQAFVVSAGACLLEFKSRLPLVYNKENSLNPKFIF